MLSNGEGKSTTTFIKKKFSISIKFWSCFSLGLDFTIARKRHPMRSSTLLFITDFLAKFCANIIMDLRLNTCTKWNLFWHDQQRTIRTTWFHCFFTKFVKLSMYNYSNNILYFEKKRFQIFRLKWVKLYSTQHIPSEKSEKMT